MADSGIAFGPFHLGRRIGQGGMAEVFLATSSGPRGFKKRLVIKRLLPHLETSERFTQMFLEEARIAALVDHPHLAQVWDCGEVDGRHYLAMEYVDGATLAELLRVHHSVAAAVACAIAIDLLDALHAIHTSTDLVGDPLKLVHRDVTPRNVMISRSGLVKLLDFGIAVPVGQVGASPMGTLRYMAPEQVLNLPLDARADLYAVGVVLFQLIVGRPPFEERPGPVPERPNEIPETLWAILRRALEPDPELRWRTAREMQTALEALALALGPRPSRTQLSDLVAIARPSLTRQALTRVTRLTRTLFARTETQTIEPAPATPPMPPPLNETATPTPLIVFEHADDPPPDTLVIAPRRPRALPVALAALVPLLIAALVLQETVAWTTDQVPAPQSVALAVPAPAEEIAPPEPEPPREQKKLRAKPSVKPRKRRAPEPARELRPATSEPAYLSVDTRPWTEVLLDGRAIGTTPMERVQITSGTHRITLRNTEFHIEQELEFFVRPEAVHAIRRVFDGGAGERAR
jgi:eukaryotic-like serine/threonine-protein kinase